MASPYCVPLCRFLTSASHGGGISRGKERFLLKSDKAQLSRSASYPLRDVGFGNESRYGWVGLFALSRRRRRSLRYHAVNHTNDFAWRGPLEVLNLFISMSHQAIGSSHCCRGRSVDNDKDILKIRECPPKSSLFPDILDLSLRLKDVEERGPWETSQSTCRSWLTILEMHCDNCRKRKIESLPALHVTPPAL